MSLEYYHGTLLIMEKPILGINNSTFSKEEKLNWLSKLEDVENKE